MPARPIRGAPRIVCAKPPTCSAAAQQQDASGRLNSMAQTAEQLAAQQKQQADHVRDLMAQQNAPRAAGQQPNEPSAQEIDKMINDRQQVSDDLAHLTQQLRDAARELAPTQPAASTNCAAHSTAWTKTISDTRMQRSSDWLRSGSFPIPLETGLTSDLQKLGQQVGDAARALGSASVLRKMRTLNRAMDDLARLRDQLNNLGGRAARVNNRSSRDNNLASRARVDKTASARLMRLPAMAAGQGQQGQGQQGQGQQGQGQQGQGRAKAVSSRRRTARAAERPGSGGRRAARWATASPASSIKAVAGPTTRAIAGR